jgi:hypothetical protein
MKLDGDAIINIGSASLKSLKIYYIAAVPAVGDTPAVLKEYGLFGQTTGARISTSSARGRKVTKVVLFCCSI